MKIGRPASLWFQKWIFQASAGPATRAGVSLGVKGASVVKRILIIAEDVRCFQELCSKLQADDASIVYASSLKDGLEMYQTQEFNMAFLISPTPPGELESGITAKPDPQASRLLIIAPIDTADDNILDFLLGRVPKPCVQASQNGTISIGSLLIEPEFHRVTQHGERVWLTPKEFDILYLLAQNYGRVLSKLQIYNSVWEHDEAFNIDNTVSCHVQALRRKLGPALDSDTPEIHTTWGVGISLIIQPERAKQTETRQELA